MKELSRKCPVCAFGTGEILHHQKFHLSDHSILPSSYDVVCCGRCNFVFADTEVDQTVYNRYYTEYSKYEDSNSQVSTGGGTSVWDKKRIQDTARDIAKHCAKDSSILDIGCANGGLLLELKKNGYKNLFGLDPSKACVNYVNNLGISCFLGELFEAKKYVDGKTFEFIILSHVFEHIYDVRRAAAAVRDLLQETGSVYIEVPDASNYSKHYIVPYYYFDTEHINHFDGHSLINLFRSAGFELTTTVNKSFYVNDTTVYPAVYAIFRKADSKQNFDIVKDDSVKKEIEQYIELSKANSATQEIENLARTREPVVVFGAGNFTARLLETTPLRSCNISAYVDNDKKKQGVTFDDKPVYGPEFVKTFTGTIVVCSALFHQQIVDQLKNTLGVKNNIVIIK